MSEEVTIDYITHNPDKTEFALYLVEGGDWSNLSDRLQVLQNRIYNAVDITLDGQLASGYPDSRGKKVRIDVVAKGDISPPKEVKRLVDRLNEIVNTEDDYVGDIEGANFLSSLSIVYTEEIDQSENG